MRTLLNREHVLRTIPGTVPLNDLGIQERIATQARNELANEIYEKLIELECIYEADLAKKVVYAAPYG